MSSGRNRPPNRPRIRAKYCPSVQSAAMPRSALCHRCRWLSTSPGSTTHPRQSTISASTDGPTSPIAVSRPPSTSTSPTKGSRPGARGTTHPPRSTVRFVICVRLPHRRPPRGGPLTPSADHSTVDDGRRQDVSAADPGTAWAGAPAMTSTLVGVQGHLAGQLFLISEQPLTLGRGASNDVVLEDAAASRVHAELRRTKGGVVLKDLGSGNGTFVNGKRVT